MNLMYVNQLINKNQILLMKILFELFLLECKTGYIGPNCTAACPYPYYGENCLKQCQCKEHSCDHSAGCTTPTTG